LATLLANQTAVKALPPTIAKSGNRKMVRLPALLLAYSCLTNHSEAASLNFGMHNLRPSDVKVIFQRPSCDYPYSGGFKFYCR